MKNKNILITGCHGDIALSICKIIRRYFPDNKIYGADTIEDGVGKVFFNEVMVLPRAGDSSYLESLSTLILKHDIGLMIPASEPELRFLSKVLAESGIGGCKIIMANRLSQEIGFDKLKTSQFLESAELPFIKSQGTNSPLMIDYPVIYKPRASAGSRGLQILHSAKDLKALGQLDQDFIFQEYVSSPENEYTCCVFSDGHVIRDLSVKRTMRYGLTLTAYPVKIEAISELLQSLAKKLDLRGSINVQLRMDQNNIPKVFEINPRFSSTVYYRHLINFCDVIWSVEYALGKPISKYEGFLNKKLYRHFEDSVIAF